MYITYHVASQCFHFKAPPIAITYLSLSLSMQPCNPAVGGPAKSQLVHEVDALGGEIGKVSDR